MTREEALQVVSVINSMQPYVPPIVFAQLAGLRGANILTQIANGQVVCSLTDPSAAKVKEAA